MNSLGLGPLYISMSLPTRRPVSRRGMISKSRLRLDEYSSSGPYGSQSTCRQILDSASAKEEGRSGGNTLHSSKVR